MKPSFVAPAVPLEKSLQEQIEQPPSASEEEKEEQDGAGALPKGMSEEDSINLRLMGLLDDKESPSEANPASEAAASGGDLPITDEEKEKLQQQDSAPSSSSPSEKRKSDDRQLQESLRRSFTLSGRPFLESVFACMECSENDYLPLFALCLIYAMQQNAGSKNIILFRLH